MKITKDQYNALSDAQKKLFKAEGDEFIMIGDTEIAREALAARDREKVRADELATQLADATTKLSDIEGNNARKTGDIATIEKSWEKKLKDSEKAAKEVLDKLKSKIEKLLVDNEVIKLATELFTKPNRDARLIKERVTVDYDGDEPKLRVLDKDGKPSALTLTDLRKEIVDNEDYSDILIGSKGGGSGGTGGNQGGGATKQPKDLTEAERIQLHATNPARFRELFPTTA